MDTDGSKTLIRIPTPRPQFLPPHQQIPGAGPVPISNFFDIPLFLQLTKIPVVEINDIKVPIDSLESDTSKLKKEGLACYSSQELCTFDHSINPTPSFGAYGMEVHYYPLPKLTRGPDFMAIVFDALKVLDWDRARRQEWENQLWEGVLDKVRSKGSVSPGVGPAEQTEIDATQLPAKLNDQVICYDNTLFMASSQWIDPWPSRYEDEADEIEDDSWLEVGRFLYFRKEINNLAGRVLDEILGEADQTRYRHRGRWVVPKEARGLGRQYIAVHIRRTDFSQVCATHSTDCYVPLSKYADAVDQVRRRSRERLQTSEGGLQSSAQGHQEVDGWKVLAMTDEKDPQFLGQVKALGWVLVDHESLRSIERWGPWAPTIM